MVTTGVPKGGLKQNTEHYDEIYDKFVKREKGYDINRYCGDAIFRSKADYQLKYDPRQFKQSLGRMVNKIKSKGGPEPEAPAPAPATETVPPTPPPPPPAAKSTPKSQTPKQPAPFSKPFSPAPAPAPAVYEVHDDYEELTANDENLLELPNHLFTWKDSQHNDRLTLMVYLPAGVTAAEVAPCIVDGGNQFQMKMVWPALMSDPRLPMYAGTNGAKPFYEQGHIKVVSFQSSVQQMKGGSETNDIVSVFRLDLPATVEELFSDFDVPSPLNAVKYAVRSKQNPHARPQQGWCVVCEMMVERSNYKDGFDVENFAVDFDNMRL